MIYFRKKKRCCYFSPKLCLLFQISDIMCQGKVTFGRPVGLWVMAAKKKRVHPPDSSFLCYIKGTLLLALSPPMHYSRSKLCAAQCSNISIIPGNTSMVF